MAVTQISNSGATDGDVGDVPKLSKTSPQSPQPSSSSPFSKLDKNQSPPDERQSLLHENQPLRNENQPLLDESEAMSPDDSTDDDASKRVLNKIDQTIIPLLFVTYMFNFMDKAILSSAAVFGLREDNVHSPPPPPKHHPHH